MLSGQLCSLSCIFCFLFICHVLSDVCVADLCVDFSVSVSSHPSDAANKEYNTIHQMNYILSA